MTGEFKSLKQALQSEPFVITAEIPPPVSAGPAELEAKIDLLKGSVHAINITDNAGAMAHMSSLAGSAIVLNKGIDPIFQITCRDRNRETPSNVGPGRTRTSDQWIMSPLV